MIIPERSSSLQPIATNASKDIIPEQCRQDVQEQHLRGCDAIGQNREFVLIAPLNKSQKEIGTGYEARVGRTLHCQ